MFFWLLHGATMAIIGNTSLPSKQQQTKHVLIRPLLYKINTTYFIFFISHVRDIFISTKGWGRTTQYL